VDFFELIEKRYSVRAYKPDPVDEQLLQKVFHAARMAPTAANRQPVELVVARTAGRRAELAQVYHREWFSQAPLVICVAGIPEQGYVRASDGKNHTEIDAAIIMDHLTLAAASLGLGTCWIAAFNPAAAAEFFCLRPGRLPVVLTPIGYPDDQPRPKQRKLIDELVIHLD
jgi:nitroreductase